MDNQYLAGVLGYHENGIQSGPCSVASAASGGMSVMSGISQISLGNISQLSICTQLTEAHYSQVAQYQPASGASSVENIDPNNIYEINRQVHTLINITQLMQSIFNILNCRTCFVVMQDRYTQQILVHIIAKYLMPDHPFTAWTVIAFTAILRKKDLRAFRRMCRNEYFVRQLMIILGSTSSLHKSLIIDSIRMLITRNLPLKDFFVRSKGMEKLLEFMTCEHEEKVLRSSATTVLTLISTESAKYGMEFVRLQGVQIFGNLLSHGSTMLLHELLHCLAAVGDLKEALETQDIACTITSVLQLMGAHDPVLVNHGTAFLLNVSASSIRNKITMVAERAPDTLLSVLSYRNSYLAIPLPNVRQLIMSISDNVLICLANLTRNQDECGKNACIQVRFRMSYTRESERYAKRAVLADISRDVIPRLVLCEAIPPLPLKLSDVVTSVIASPAFASFIEAEISSESRGKSERFYALAICEEDQVLFPLESHEGVTFCIVCGRHTRQRFLDHMRRLHSQFEVDSNEFKAVVHTSRAITEYSKNGFLDLDKVRDPQTVGEWNLFSDILSQLRNTGVLVIGRPKSMPSADKHLYSNIPSHNSSNSPYSYDLQLNQNAVDVLRPPDTHHGLIYRYRGDPCYKGGANVHRIFLELPKTKLMFAHADDDAEGYVEQNFTLPHNAEEWMQTAHNSLGLWKKISIRDPLRHIALHQYLQHLEECSKYDEKLSKKKSNYGMYVMRFLLVAMRARQRYGEDVTFDDMIFSAAIIVDFFTALRAIDATCNVQIAFAKAVSHMMKFLELKTDLCVLANSIRKQALKSAQKSLHYYASLNAGMQRFKKSMEGITYSRDPVPKYCLSRAILNSYKVDKAVEKVEILFSETGFVTHAEYNFVMGALMSYIVVFNTARNECVYKLRYGSIWPAAGSDNTGLQKRRATVNEEEHNFWVGRYPNPKNVLQKSATSMGGTFVLDDKSRRWQKTYDLLREWIVSHKTGDVIPCSDEVYFLLYDGSAVKPDSTRSIMRRFFKSSGVPHLNTSCSAARRSSAARQYRELCAKLLKTGAVAEAASLSGHSARTQVMLYSRVLETAIDGYCFLKELAQKEAMECKTEIDAALEMIKIRGVRGYNTFRDETSGQSEETDEEDCEERSGIDESSSDSSDGHSEEWQCHRDYNFDSESVFSTSKIPEMPYPEKGVRETEDSLRDNEGEELDAVTTHLLQLNKATYKLGLYKLENDFEMSQFLRLRQAKPVQAFTWLEVREVPAVHGRGIFAKIDIPKGSVVCDYRGYMGNLNDIDEMLKQLSHEDRHHVEDYLLESQAIHQGRHFFFGVLGHEPVYKGSVVLGRLINHSSDHPNLQYYVKTIGKYQFRTIVLFKATRDIYRDEITIKIGEKELGVNILSSDADLLGGIFIISNYTGSSNWQAGEQLLWNYGVNYDKRKLRKRCICNVCDSALAAESSTRLKSVKMRAPVHIKWDEDLSLSQQLLGRRPPLNVEELLLTAAHKSNAVGFLLDWSSIDSLTAYQRSRNVVFGTKINSDELLQTLWYACTDAFNYKNSSIVILMKTSNDHRPVVILFGAYIRENSLKRYGSCVAYVAREKRTYAVVDQTEATGSLLPIHAEFRNGTLLTIRDENNVPWSDILRIRSISLDDLVRLLKKSAH